MQTAAAFMQADPISHVRTLVVGLGSTGLSCARFLAHRGIEVAVTDTREQPPQLATMQQELPDIALFLGGFDADAFARAQRIVVSPGVSLREPMLVQARRRGVEILGDIELFARVAAAPIVAITGSNGKSTVTTLVGAMARRAGADVRVGGNLGVPALDLLGDSEPDLYVLELSSFQLESVYSLHSRAATVLNVSADHMDRYDSLQSYVEAKQRIYRGAAVQVINRDDPVAAALATDSGAAIGFTRQAPSGNDFGIRAEGNRLWIVRGTERWMPTSDVRMPGAHNLANALAALALGEAAGLPASAMMQVLREFQGLAHRTQWVGEHRGVRWFNDSKATNIGAALAAIRGFEGPLVLIAGGRAKGAEFAQLAEGMDQRVKAVVLLGESAPAIAAALEGRIATTPARDMTDAVRKAADIAVAGDTVLLSPACASFDMFTDYQHRGEVFMRAVQELHA
jgi:UDP-N-acetylmuramoylalanine--D-glutamate ligase